MVCEKFSATAFRSGAVDAVKIENTELFDVRKTFDCGQCFRFDEVYDSMHEVEYAGFALGKYISVAQDGDSIIIYNINLNEYEKIFRKYLSLNIDYKKINDDILSRSDNKNLRSAVEKGSGIRILNQDGWESLCSFIVSQNNNIPRIKKLIAALCGECDHEKETRLSSLKHMEGHISEVHRGLNGAFSPFPTPRQVGLLGQSRLSELKFGFRSKYIDCAADYVGTGKICLDELYFKKTSECMDMLCEIKGVGPKVALCSLLFGFGHLDAFPVDVWIKKVIEKYFDKNFSPDMLGAYAGVAQQYLFYYERYLDGDGRQNEEQRESKVILK